MASQKTVGVLLFEGFELLDVFGPLEAWGMHAEIPGACTIVTAAERAGAVKSAQGPRAIADYALADCPRIDVILVPGGIGTRHEVKNATLLDWLRRRAAEAEIVTSVCTGAALLARWTARRAPRDLQQAFVQMGDRTGSGGGMGKAGAMGRGRQVRDFIGSLGRHRHDAGFDREAL